MSMKREQLGFMNQFPNAKTSLPWDMKTIQVSGNALVTVKFDDTQPNMFLLQNPNDTILHVGITNIPTTDSYEFKVEGNTSKTFGRPIPTSELFILNKSNANVTIQLFSVYDTFDMSVLVDNHLSIDYNRILYDGIITGFGTGVSLPSGTNKLGSVDIANAEFTNMADDIESIRSMLLSVKNNQIGVTDNTRDILSLMKGTYAVGTSEKNLLDEIVTTLSNMSSGGESIDYTEKLTSLIDGMNVLSTKLDTINTTVGAEKTYTPVAFCKNIGSTSDDVSLFSYTDDDHTEENPVVCLDFVKWIRCDGAIPVTVKLYYTFADYIELSLAPDGELHDFDFPIYGLVVMKANSDDTGSSTVNIFGGKYN